MHPLDCPAWEYNTHPQKGTIATRVSEMLIALASGGLNTISVATDSRDVHRSTFRELTPPDCEYYAGHYRGEAFRCLRFYRVQVASDPRVGAMPGSVAFLMRELSTQIGA